MTRKDAAKLAAAIRSIADLPAADRATIDAVAAAVAFAFDEALPLAFRTASTGRIDLSGVDKIAALANRQALAL